MPPPTAATSTHRGNHRTRAVPGVTVLALCILTVGWFAFALIAPTTDYTDYQQQHVSRQASDGQAGAGVGLGRTSGAAATHLGGFAQSSSYTAGKKAVAIGTDSNDDGDSLAFTVQRHLRDNHPDPNLPSHSHASSLPPSAHDSPASLSTQLRLKLDKTATLLGDFLLGLFGIDDGAEWFSEGEFDYETSQSGLDGGTLSSWSESSVYVERTNSLHPSRPSSFGPHILDEPLRGYLFPIEFASAADSYACSLSTATTSGTPSEPWIALIQRGKCPFSEKVRFAQRLGAEAVVFGDQSETEGGISGGHGLLTPWSPENTDDIKIPSTFVSRASYLSLIRTWKDEQDIVKHAPNEDDTPPPPMQDGSTQTDISPRGRGGSAAKDFVGLEVVLSKDEMLASPFLDLLFVLLFLPSLLTLVTVFIQRIRLARAAQAERAPKDAVARLPVFRWGDHHAATPAPTAGGASASSPTGATPLEKNKGSGGAGRATLSDEEREIGVETERPASAPRVSISHEQDEPDEETTLLPHPSPHAPTSTSTSAAAAPSLAQRAFARLPFVVQRFLPSFIRPPVPSTPTSSSRSRLNNAVPTRRFPSIVECPFCLCDFENGDTVMELPCGHLFHDEEVRGWLEGQKGVCPVCRTSVLNSNPTGGAAASAATATTPIPIPASAVMSANTILEESNAGTPRASSTRTDTTIRPTPQPATTTRTESRTPIASTSSVRIEDPSPTTTAGAAGGRPRSL
ncbi:hypothetical protein JCM10908_000530 [Rhodotorula pacifica]|uniref:uncharacterized protein n=1 Tax=Rhodotorula pacifica TaxID=1495444 RepID=UPI003177AAF0